MTAISSQFPQLLIQSLNNNLPTVKPDVSIQGGLQGLEASVQVGVQARVGQQSSPLQIPDGMVQASGQSPVNLSGGVQGGQMTVYGAAGALVDHFRLAEGMGTDGKGTCSGDQLIGEKELKQLVRPDSGAPPHLQQAAQFLLNNEPARESIGEMTLNNLQAFRDSAPPDSVAPVGNPSLQSGMSTSLVSQTGSMGSGQGAAKPMSIYGAAQAIKNHFTVAEGVGMDGKGKGAGDGNIGFSELKQLASNKNVPPELQQAAKLLINDKTIAAVIDGNKGASGDAHIKISDLDKIIASAPKSGASGTTGTTNLSLEQSLMTLKAKYLAP